MKKVVVTGVGMVTPLGNNVASTWDALMRQKSGIDTIRNFDASGFPARIAAEVKDFDRSLIPKKLAKHALNFAEFAMVASKEALDDAGIVPNDETAEDWGLVVGSGMMVAEFDYLKRYQQRYAKNGEPAFEEMGRVDPAYFKTADFARLQSNAALGLLLKQHGILGYSTSVHTACASGGQALALAMRAIRRGECEYMLTGGFDSMINPLGVSSFCLLGALSTDNESPQSASRPFDLTRQGFVLGEGAAFLVLECEAHAKKRGAKIYAELAGAGNSLTSFRITDSPESGDGAIQAIEGALRDAGLNHQDIDYINAHGTSTKMNDLSETNAIKHVLKDHAYQTPVSSTKSQTGHLIAAAGALEGVISSLAIYHNQIPMTANLKMPDPECDLDYVKEGPREKTVRAVLSNSFGFGGSNSCLAFKEVS